MVFKIAALLLCLSYAGLALADGEPLINGGVKWVEGQRELVITCRGQKDGIVHCDPAKTEYYPVYSIGIVDRSGCPNPSLLIYSPNCSEYVEITTVRAKGESKWLTDEEAAKQGLKEAEKR